jgi:hypothetical protein
MSIQMICEVAENLLPKTKDWFELLGSGFGEGDYVIGAYQKTHFLSVMLVRG